MCQAYPPLETHINTVDGRNRINFGNADAVKALNIALLLQDYGLESYHLPEGYLVPGVTGRRQYIDQVASLLKAKGTQLSKRLVADIGVGGNCIYPLIGHKAYGWRFVGVDIDVESLKVASEIIAANGVSDAISLRLQRGKSQIIEGWIDEEEYFDFMICNPPYYQSSEEADRHLSRKWKGLNIGPVGRTFGGRPQELITEGGELGFVTKYIEESKQYASQVYSFSSLISSEAHLTKLEHLLKSLDCTERRVLPISTGNKSARILVWSFLSAKQREVWRQYRWT